MANPFSKIVHPWYPSTALGLERKTASIVHLEQARGNTYRIRSAATMNLGESLLNPGFDQQNISSTAELTYALTELATSAGLLKQKRWSVSLPEITTRTTIITFDEPTSSSELEELLAWKIERSFDTPLDELAISRERLSPDAQGRERFLVVAARSSVLAEYQSVFSALGWRAGLILPRHVGEAQWLATNDASDGLLLSSSDEGFTAIVLRGKEPIILRRIACEPDEREDELYRLLLFYRDRRAGESRNGDSLSRLLITGEGLSKTRAAEIINETLSSSVSLLEAEDLGVQLPTGELNFDSIAAPAGLARLAW